MHIYAMCMLYNVHIEYLLCTHFFPANQLFAKKQLQGQQREEYFEQFSGVKRVGGVEKLDKSYIFVYFPTHFLLQFIINTVIRGAHDTHVRYTEISKFDFLFINIDTVTLCAHDIRITHVRSMGTSNFNLLFRLLCVRIIDFDFSSIITINVFAGLVLY